MSEGDIFHSHATIQGHITAIVLGLLYLGGVVLTNYRIMKGIDGCGRIQLTLKSFFFFTIAPVCGLLYYAF